VFSFICWILSGIETWSAIDFVLSFKSWRVSWIETWLIIDSVFSFICWILSGIETWSAIDFVLSFKSRRVSWIETWLIIDSVFSFICWRLSGIETWLTIDSVLSLTRWIASWRASSFVIEISALDHAFMARSFQSWKVSRIATVSIDARPWNASSFTLFMASKLASRNANALLWSNWPKSPIDGTTSVLASLAFISKSVPTSIKRLWMPSVSCMIFCPTSIIFDWLNCCNSEDFWVTKESVISRYLRASLCTVCWRSFIRSVIASCTDVYFSSDNPFTSSA